MDPHGVRGGGRGKERGVFLRGLRKDLLLGGLVWSLLALNKRLAPWETSSKGFKVIGWGKKAQPVPASRDYPWSMAGRLERSSKCEVRN